MLTVDDPAAEVLENRAHSTAEYPKAVVALAGARDHFQLPLALHEDGLLRALVTDLYFPADQKWFESFGRLFPREWVSKRFCPELSSKRVQISGNALGAFALEKITPSLALSWYKGKVLGRKAKRLALREEAALFCYSTHAFEAFKPNGGFLPQRFLFQLHPHPRTVFDVLIEETQRVPWGKSSLMTEWELSLSSEQMLELCSEPQLANGWAVASSYTARTLSQHGIPFEKIHVVPYGVDCSVFAKRTRPPSPSKPLTAIFVGSLVQRKGLSYFLEAARILKSRSIRITLCGRGQVDRELLAHYSDLDIDLRIGLPKSQLVREIHNSDVLVLPSLAEGFAHVILETMACGLPVIATAHTCAPDVIVDGVHGFIVPIRDPSAIAEKLVWGIEHRSDLAAMGEAAAAQAGLFTWKRFRAGLAQAYREMVCSVC